MSEQTPERPPRLWWDGRDLHMLLPGSLPVPTLSWVDAVRELPQDVPLIEMTVAPEPLGCDHLDAPYRSLLARIEAIRLWARTTDQGTAAAQVQELLDAPTDRPGSDNPFAAVMEHALALAAARHRAEKSAGGGPS